MKYINENTDFNIYDCDLIITVYYAADKRSND